MGEDGATEGALPKPITVGESALIGATTSKQTGSARRAGGGLLGALSHTFHGIVDSDPEMSRRNSIGKTRESITEVSPILRRGGTRFADRLFFESLA